MAPARLKSPIRKTLSTFFPAEIDGDIANMVLDDGPRIVQLALVLVDKKWYIAAIKGVSFHP